MLIYAFAYARIFGFYAEWSAPDQEVDHQLESNETINYVMQNFIYTF